MLMIAQHQPLVFRSSTTMSGHPQGGHYDDGYGHQPHATDSYYQDDQNQGYYDQQDYQQQQHGGQHAEYQQQQSGGGYYDESWVLSSKSCGRS